MESITKDKFDSSIPKMTTAEINVGYKPKDNNKSSRKRFYIVIAIVVAVVFLSLMAVAIHFLMHRKKIHKDLITLPTIGYLFIADLNNYPTERKCEEMDTDDFDVLFENFISKKNIGVQTFALICKNMLTSNGIIIGIRKPLTEFLEKANSHGISIGIIILPSQLRQEELVNSIERIPFLSFYIYYKQKNEIDNAAIKNFADTINEKLYYTLKRSINLILELDNYGEVEEIKSIFEFIDGVVMPVDLFDAENIYVYPESVTLILIPRRLKIDENGILHQSPTPTDMKMYLISRCNFLSNASAFTNEDFFTGDEFTRYLSLFPNLDTNVLSFHSFVNDFINLRSRNDIWKKIKHALTTTDYLSNTKLALSFTIEIPSDIDSDFTHLVLVQNMNSHNNVVDFSLDLFGFIPGLKAQVLISYPRYNSLEEKIIINTNNFQLIGGGSIVLAVYKVDNARTLSGVLDAWPPSRP